MRGDNNGLSRWWRRRRSWGGTERTFRHWRGRDNTDGIEGLADRRIGRAAARALPVDAALRMVTLYETRSTGWIVKHVHARWQAEHGGHRSYRWTQKTLQAAGHVGRAPRRGAHRKKRPRNPLPGRRLHQDGSTPAGVPGCQGDVSVPLAEATRARSAAFVVEEDGTLSSVQGLREGLETRGSSGPSRRIGARTIDTPRKRGARSIRPG